jgi:hypothetical protein
MSNRITSITKRDIFKLFINGLDIDVIFGDTQHVAYPYYGLLSEIVFLNRLYNLKTMISNDSETVFRISKQPKITRNIQA